MEYIGTSIAAADGNVYNDNGGAWATVRALGTGTPQPSTDPVNIYASKLISSSIGRGFIPFNTSTIGGGARVTAGSLVINVSNKLGADGTIHLIQTTQASGTNLLSADYDNVAFSSGGSLPITAAAKGTIVLNATALGWINTTGTSFLGLIEDHDLTNTDPDPNDYRFEINMTENATAANRPTLTLTYIPSGGYIGGKYY